MNQDLISIVIINYNGVKFLQKCLVSVLNTNYENFEVIFVDNCSSDGSIDYLRREFNDRRIKLVQTDKNYGVPGGRNIGFRKAKGKYIVFLDNDSEVDREWLGELIKAFETDSKIAVAQCKLLRMTERNRFDHAGDYLTPFGFLFERSNQAIDKGQFDRIEPIFNAKGAATMVKGSIFDELGMYDDSYFMYLEETDFCFRAWIAGYKVVFVPGSIVWHAFNTPLKQKKEYYSNYVVRFYGCRNYIITLLKNLSFGNVLKIVPVHILGWLILSIAFIFKGKVKDSLWILKAIFWNLFNLVATIKKRNYVQRKLRKIRDGMFFDKVMIKKPASFYLRKSYCYLKGVPFNFD